MDLFSKHDVIRITAPLCRYFFETAEEAMSEAIQPRGTITEHRRDEKNALAGLLPPIAAFLLTAAVWTAALCLFGVAPFGSRSILITDLAQQYIEYHAALYDAVRGGSSLLYTWDGGLGMNFLGLFAYYLASPFTPLILLFPRGLLPEAVLLVVSLKLAGSACTMSLFLRKAVGARGTANVLFAAMYGLSGYAAVFFFNVMWFDAVLLLPLVLLGVRHLVRTGRFAPLAAVYTVLFLSNFYTAYMAGGFSLLFLFALLFVRRASRKEWRRAVLRLFGAAGIAAGLGAFLLLPAFFALREAQGDVGGTLPWLSLAADPLTLLGKLAFGAYDSATSSGTPNLYCGILSLGLLPAYFLHREIPRREKLAAGVLIGFLLLSMAVDPLDTLWHGGQPPVWFPGRYAFCLILLLVASSARAFSRRDGLTRRRIWLGFAASALLMLAVQLPEWLFPEEAGAFTGQLWITLGLLALYAALLTLRTGKRRVLERTALILLALCVPLELTDNALRSLRSLNTELGFEQRKTFTEYLEREEEQTALLSSLTASRGDSLSPDNFYRVEDRNARNPNDGLVRGLPALSHYSSLSRRDTFGFLRRLGMTTASSDKILRYGGSTSALDAVLGIRYVFARRDDRAGMTDVGQADGLILRANENALPLAYFADSAVLSLSANGKADPFTLQNAFFSSLEGSGEENAFFTPLSVQASCRNGTLDTPSAGTRTYVSVPAGTGRLVLTIENPACQHVLLYFSNNLPENAAVLLSDKTLNAGGERMVRGVIDLGEQEAGIVTVSFPVSGTNRWFGELYAAAFDEAAFERLTAVLREGTPDRLTVSESGAQVTAVLTAPRDGVLFTSLPADSGWTVRIDGKKAAASDVADAFLAVPLPAGEHTVALSFRPRGLTAGVALSLATAGMCLAGRLLRRRKRTKEPALPIPALEPEQADRFR